LDDPADADDPEAMEALAARLALEQASLARQALFDSRVGALDLDSEAPHLVVLLQGYPGSVAEAEECVERGVLDGVVTIVDGSTTGGTGKRDGAMDGGAGGGERPRTAFDVHAATDPRPPERGGTAPPQQELAGLHAKRMGEKYVREAARVR
jgi:hypothetical protein